MYYFGDVHAMRPTGCAVPAHGHTSRGRPHLSPTAHPVPACRRASRSCARRQGSLRAEVVGAAVEAHALARHRTWVALLELEVRLLLLLLLWLVLGCLRPKVAVLRLPVVPTRRQTGVCRALSKVAEVQATTQNGCEQTEQHREPVPDFCSLPGHVLRIPHLEDTGPQGVRHLLTRGALREAFRQMPPGRSLVVPRHRVVPAQEAALLFRLEVFVERTARGLIRVHLPQLDVLVRELTMRIGQRGHQALQCEAEGIGVRQLPRGLLYRLLRRGRHLSVLGIDVRLGGRHEDRRPVRGVGRQGAVHGDAEVAGQALLIGRREGIQPGLEVLGLNERAARPVVRHALGPGMIRELVVQSLPAPLLRALPNLRHAGLAEQRAARG
mmetsp:Transcript_170472/g.541536  ORF Transcript_170472/g.541536 Transcript_170472/m.541536 type:complete len:382 (-) Transcript_170472:1893-3038(-)